MKGKKWRDQKIGTREKSLTSLIEDCACHSCQALNLKAPLDLVSPITSVSSKIGVPFIQKALGGLQGLLERVGISLPSIPLLDVQYSLQEVISRLSELKSSSIPFQLQFNFEPLIGSLSAYDGNSEKKSFSLKVVLEKPAKNPRTILSIQA